MTNAPTKSDVDFSRLPLPVLSEHPEWVALHDYAWRTAARNIRTSLGRRHMDCAWDHRRNYQWVWDSCFMALYCRYAADQFPGIASLDNFYDLQRADGYISMTYDLDARSEPYPDRINPPLFAWVEWEHYRTTGDGSRLARAAGHIERLMEWIGANRRNRPHRRRTAADSLGIGAGESTDNYRLYYFEDGGSSGMDDSPRTPRLPEAGQFYDWIDLSSQMALSFRSLAEIRAALKDAPAAERWRKRADELGALINAELWCERTRFYHDRLIPMNLSANKTAAGFWPMLAGICPADRLDALVAHLRDEREFNRPMPVPSLSADDPNYSPDGVYWVGGVWAPTNYMIARGLMRAGRGDVAHEIAMKYLSGLARTFSEVEPHTLWECYGPETALPGLCPYTRERVKPEFVGWTGIGPIAMLIENVIGLDLDLAASRVEWTIRLTEEHGVRRLPVGPGARAEFLCRKRVSADAPAVVSLRSDAALKVLLRRGSHCAEILLPAGREQETVV